MNFKLFLLCITVVAVIGIGAIALSDSEDSEGATSGDWTYETNNSKVTILTYTGGSGDIVIPSEIGGHPVVQIGRNSNRVFPTTLTNSTISFPNTVETIYSRAFYKCSGFIGSLTLPSSLKDLGSDAFYGCSGFTGALVIPEGVTRVGDGCFDKCTGFTSLSLPHTLQTIGYSNQNAFGNMTGCTGILTIPSSVKSIGRYAFYGCTGFTGLVFEENSSLTATGYCAFEKFGSTGVADLSSLTALSGIDQNSFDYAGFTKVILPSSITYIGQNAFYGCANLQEVEFSQSAYGNYSISSSAFYNCTSLIGIDFPEGLTSIGNDAFSGCTSLESIEFPSTLTSISYGAFYNCTNMSGSLIFPVGMTSIGGGSTSTSSKGAFESCSSLNGNLVIPSTVKTIGRNCFKNCSGLTGSNDFSNLTSVADYAFQNCSGLTGDLDLSSLTTINSSIFDGCSGLNGSLSLNENVTKVDSYAFRGCSGLSGSLIIPDSVTSFGSQCFVGCSGFNALVLGNGITSISGTFTGCSGFKGDLTIPASVTSIGAGAFKDCTGFDGVLRIKSTGNLSISNASFENCGFSGIFFGDGISSLSITGDGTFRNCGFIGKLELPDNTLLIGNYAFYNCTGLTDIIIPATVREISSLAFGKCSGVKNVVLCGTPATVSNNAFGDYYSGYLNVDEVLNLGTYNISNGWRGIRAGEIRTGEQGMSDVSMLQDVGHPVHYEEIEVKDDSPTGTILLAVPIFVVLGILMYAVQYFRDPRKL